MLSVDWITKIITVPQSDLTLISGTAYNLDVSQLLFLLRELNSSEEGIAQTVNGTLYSNTSPSDGTPRVVKLVEGYTIQFENLLYSVDIINGNTNIRDVEIKNQVSVGTNNVSGFNTIAVGSGLSPAQDTRLTEVHQDRGLDAVSPKTITENTSGSSYDEDAASITKEVRKVGSVTTITRQ